MRSPGGCPCSTYGSLFTSPDSLLMSGKSGVHTALQKERTLLRGSKSFLVPPSRFSSPSGGGESLHEHPYSHRRVCDERRDSFASSREGSEGEGTCFSELTRGPCSGNHGNCESNEVFRGITTARSHSGDGTIMDACPGCGRAGTKAVIRAEVGAVSTGECRRCVR